MIGGSNRVKLEERDDAVIVNFTEDILDDAEDLRYALRCIFESGRPRIVFDMSEARYVSARVLGLLADSIREARKNRGEVKIICSDGRLNRLLERVGFCHAVEIVSSSDDALDGFADGILAPEKLMLWKDREVYARA